VSWQRARTPGQKEERRQAILGAAAALLTERPPDQISLNEIARRCQLTKSNLYRYFSSREEIFMAILSNDLDEWAAALRDLGLGANPTNEDIAHALMSSVIRPPRLLLLLGQLTSVIERNVAMESLIDFKLQFKERSGLVAEALAAQIPGFTKDTAMQLLFHQLILIQGLWPLLHPSEVISELADHPEVGSLFIPFEHALLGTLLVAIRGLRS
jgi:AcrR family transcriptional regulator